jgi:hypothetical protein
LPLSPEALIRLVTVLLLWASTAPRNRPASLGADRGSRTAARRENHWHGAGSGCEDDMAGSDRGDGLVW